jgi:phosphatidylinositol-3,4,5-trisphosphate 3-phosphatase/dual-specificity protein phosphatase PTEN
VERGRELRLKLHLSSLPLGWLWLIPAFHLPEPTGTGTHTLQFPKSQIDFALGPGAAIQEVLIEFDEIAEGQGEGPSRLLSEREEKEEGVEDGKGEKVLEAGE